MELSANFLTIGLLHLLYILNPVTARPYKQKHAMFHSGHSLTDVYFERDLIHDTRTSRVGCASLCHTRVKCRSYFYNKVKHRCRTHSTIFSDDTGAVHEDGWEYYGKRGSSVRKKEKQHMTSITTMAPGMGGEPQFALNATTTTPAPDTDEDDDDAADEGDVHTTDIPSDYTHGSRSGSVNTQEAQPLSSKPSISSTIANTRSEIKHASSTIGNTRSERKHASSSTMANIRSKTKPTGTTTAQKVRRGRPEDKSITTQTTSKGSWVSARGTGAARSTHAAEVEEGGTSTLSMPHQSSKTVGTETLSAGKTRKDNRENLDEKTTIIFDGQSAEYVLTSEANSKGEMMENNYVGGAVVTKSYQSTSATHDNLVESHPTSMTHDEEIHDHLDFLTTEEQTDIIDMSTALVIQESDDDEDGDDDDDDDDGDGVTFVVIINDDDAEESDTTHSVIMNSDADTTVDVITIDNHDHKYIGQGHEDNDEDLLAQFPFTTDLFGLTQISETQHQDTMAEKKMTGNKDVSYSSNQVVQKPKTELPTKTDASEGARIAALVLMGVAVPVVGVGMYAVYRRRRTGSWTLLQHQNDGLGLQLIKTT